MAVIEVKNFRKSFGKKVVHEDVSFYVRKGECLGLVGGSGAGKSVILRSLIGLESPNSGQVLINDQNVTDFTEPEWQIGRASCRERVCYAV